jgi:hypothetical protein
MRQLSINISVAIVLLCSPVFAAPLVSVGEYLVEAEGLTPGGDAIWFSVSRERPRWMTKLVTRTEKVSDDDNDGRVELELDNRVSLQSIWFIVDLTTGEYGVAVPDGFLLKRLGFPEAAIQQAGVIEVTERDIEALLVRPGIGCWTYRSSDGGARDGDGTTNGRIRASISMMQAHSEATIAPMLLQPDDTLLIIDPWSLEFYARSASEEEQSS